MASFNRELLEQLKNKYLDEEVKSAIAKENLYHAVDESGDTLLHYTVKWSNVKITQYLIDSGSKVDAENNAGKTPLILAVESHSREDIFKILIEAGACVFKQDRNGKNALKIYGDSIWTDSRIGELLLKNCDFPKDNQKIVGMLHEYGWSLLKTISLRNVDITRQLFDPKYACGVTVETEYSNVKFSLYCAVLSADVKNVKLLLNYFDVNRNMTNNDFLFALVALFHEDISINRPNERMELLKMLLERIDSLLSDEGIYDESVGHLLRRGNKEAIEMLMQRDLDLSLEIGATADGDAAGDTVVHSLVRNENPGVIEMLRGKNFDVNVRNQFGHTPLMLAAHSGNADAVEFLLEVGADIYAIDYEGLTALCKAILNCTEDRELQYRDCIQILLERGVNTQLVNLCVDDDERTIVDILLEDGEDLVSDLVLSHLALQESLGNPNMQLIRNKINSYKSFKDDFESSQRELTDKVYQSITLFNLLTDSDRKLERYARNQEIHSILENFGSKKCKSDYFNSILQKRISKTVHTVELRKEAADIVCKIMKINYESFFQIGDEIASYLQLEDMKNLLDTISVI